MSHFSWKQETLEIQLRVVPRASRDAISGLMEDRLKVTITAPPVDGRANAHLIRWFAELCDVSKSNVGIISGQTGRNKTIAIRNPQRLPAELGVRRPGESFTKAD